MLRTCDCSYLAAPQTITSCTAIAALRLHREERDTAAAALDHQIMWLCSVLPVHVINCRSTVVSLHNSDACARYWKALPLRQYLHRTCLLFPTYTTLSPIHCDDHLHFRSYGNMIYCLQKQKQIIIIYCSEHSNETLSLTFQSGQYRHSNQIGEFYKAQLNFESNLHVHYLDFP